MIAFLQSLAIAFGIIALCLIIGVPIGYWYLTRVVFPLLNIPYETHHIDTDCLSEADASGISDC